MTILVRLNTEAPTGSAAPTLQSLSSRCRSQSCDLAPVWMDGVAWTCGSESSGRWPCILTWSLNHSTHISTVHHQHLLSWNTLQGQGHHLWQFRPNTLVYYNITYVSHIVYHNAYVIHLISSHCTGVLSSHIITKRRVHVVVQPLSQVWLWHARTCQTPLSMGFSTRDTGVSFHFLL